MKDTLKPVKKNDLAENEKEVSERFDPKLKDGYKNYWDSEYPADEVNKDAPLD